MKKSITIIIVLSFILILYLIPQNSTDSLTTVHDNIIDLPTKSMAVHDNIIDLPTKSMAVHDNIIDLPTKSMAVHDNIIDLPTKSIVNV